MRRALAHQIRRPQKAIGTGGDFGGFGSELVVGFEDAARVCHEGVTKPTQGESCGLGNAHNVPATRDGVAKGVDAAARVERRTIRCGKNDAGSTDGGADRSSRHDAHSGGPGRLVACTCNDGSAGAQT